MTIRVLLLDRGVMGNPHVLGLASGLRSHGVEVRIGGPIANSAQAMTAVFPPGDVKGRWISKGMSVPGGLKRFRSLIEEFRPEIVHFNWPTPVDGIYRRWLRDRTSAAVVYTAHEPLRDGRYGKRQAAFLRDADAVLVFGPTLREQLLARWPRLTGRVTAVALGNYEHVARRFDRDYARRELGIATDGGPLYVFVGTIRRAKGLETLVDAFAGLTRRGGPGSLLIAGTGADERYLAEVRARCPEEDAGIRWLVSRDRLEHRVLDLAASAADQVVLPFREASASGSVIFAMTHGRCVVTTRVGEIPRTVENHGILVAPDDADALEEALRLASAEPERCARLGRDAREHVKRRLAWPAVAGEVVEAYEAARRGLVS